MSTIFVDPRILNGVVLGVAGFDATGATVTAVGLVPLKSKVMAGSTAVAGIKARVWPSGIVATCEFGVEPTLITT
jgi:hypothetical protein